MEIRPKPANHLFHFSLQAIGIFFCVYYCLHLPKSGKALLILGGIVAIMMLMDMRPLHKGIYVAIILGLILIENHALDKERTDSAKEQRDRQKEENDRFQAIADGLKSSIQQGQEQFKATSAGIGKSVETITGGTTFCLVKAMPMGNQLAMVVGTRGSYPLHGVTVQMIDVDLVNQLNATKRPITVAELNSFQTAFPEIPFLAQGAGRTVTLLSPDERDKRILTFNFFSLNGSWTEDLRLTRVNGQWEQAMRILKVRAIGQPLIPLYEWASEHYPKVNGK